MTTENPKEYSVEWISNFFHGFPHIDFKFNKADNTFQPTDNKYRQSILFWALVPLAACCLLWLVFLFYFIIRCCQKGNRRKRKPSTCARVFTGVLIFLSLGLLGLGLYQNETVHHGVNTARQAAVDASNIVISAVSKISNLENIAEDVKNVSYALEQKISVLTNETFKNASLQLIENIRNDSIMAQEICQKLKVDDYQAEIENATDLTNEIEYYRWVTTIVIDAVYIFISFLTTVGLLLKSRRTLIVSALTAVVCSLFLWLSAGVYLGSSVALGDFCVAPGSYAISLVDPKYENIAAAYINCSDPKEPYQTDIVLAQTAISKAISNLEDIKKLVITYGIKNLDKPLTKIENDLTNAIGNLSTLLNSVGTCTTLHQYYITGVAAMCTDTIYSTSLLSLACSLIGVIFTFIIFIISCIWRGFLHRKRTDYINADDTDPFLPRPPPYESDYGAVGQSSPRPWSERGSLQQASASNLDDQYVMTMHPHAFPDESPPPAYYPGTYGRRTIEVRATTNY